MKLETDLTLHIWCLTYTVGEKIIWSPAVFVRLPTDKEIIIFDH